MDISGVGIRHPMRALSAPEQQKRAGNRALTFELAPRERGALPVRSQLPQLPPDRASQPQNSRPDRCQRSGLGNGLECDTALTQLACHASNYRSRATGQAIAASQETSLRSGRGYVQKFRWLLLTSLSPSGEKALPNHSPVFVCTGSGARRLP